MHQQLVMGRQQLQEMQNNPSQQQKVSVFCSQVIYMCSGLYSSMSNVVHMPYHVQCKCHV